MRCQSPAPNTAAGLSQAPGPGARCGDSWGYRSGPTLPELDLAVQGVGEHPKGHRGGAVDGGLPGWPPALSRFEVRPLCYSEVGSGVTSGEPLDFSEPQFPLLRIVPPQALRKGRSPWWGWQLGAVVSLGRHIGLLGKWRRALLTRWGCRGWNQMASSGRGSHPPGEMRDP